jgi:hypothetical protein
MNLDVYKNAGFTTPEMRALEDLLSLAQLHWISLNPETGIYEITLDNQMMATFRSCPSHFVEAYVKGIAPKGGGRAWPLDFGIVFHKLMESYYKDFRTGGFSARDWAINQAVDYWNSLDMDFHKEHKEYKSIGGVQGFCGLLMGYAMRFGPENERLRVIGTEISFGKAKEVLLGSIQSQPYMPYHDDTPLTIFAENYLRLYLSGRIDVLVDDGKYICPLDHKTMGSFRNDPTMRFEMEEGPTGYIFAVSQILPEFLKAIKAEDFMLQRSTNKIIMNYISKSIPKEGDRYKRANIMKTTEQLEAYRKRMLCTGEDIFRALVRFANSGFVWRDTSKCTSWYMHDCQFLPIHRQNSRANELAVIDSFYEKIPIWDTEEV